MLVAWVDILLLSILGAGIARKIYCMTVFFRWLSSWDILYVIFAGWVVFSLPRYFPLFPAEIDPIRVLILQCCRPTMWRSHRGSFSERETVGFCRSMFVYLFTLGYVQLSLLEVQNH